MADIARLLETMHPMREPPAPAAITPILATLAIGCAAALVVLGVLWHLRQRRAALRAAAEAMLAASRSLAPGERLAQQALLLRRLARGIAGEEAARAQGRAWLAKLDEIFATRFFTQGEGTAYGETLYRRPGGLDLDALDRALSGFIGKMRVSKADSR